MSDMILHCGGQKVNRDALDLYKVPTETATYMPVSHYDLAKKILTISQDLLTDYILVGEQYGIAKNGNQLFAVLNFHDNNEDMALSVAFRNSYDRSMAIGMAIGATVFICDNLALSGSIVVMKKHTKNVWQELEDATVNAIYKGGKNFKQIIADSVRFQKIALDDKEAFKMMGLLYGNEIISPRQLTALKEQWIKPDYKEFEPRTMWSFYNAGTEALKTTPPIMTMERHVEFHKAMMDLSNVIDLAPDNEVPGVESQTWC